MSNFFGKSIVALANLREQAYTILTETVALEATSRKHNRANWRTIGERRCNDHQGDPREGPVSIEFIADGMDEASTRPRWRQGYGCDRARDRQR